jgi:hypothetical protein
VAWLSVGLALALAILWLSSDRWYTTVGFDFERPWEGGRLTRYVRVRWDARCFWFGQAEQPVAPQGRRMDWWDPGGTLFAPSVRPEPRSLLNRCGWWLILGPADDPYEPIRYVGAISSQWVGIPGWIPPVVFGAWPLARSLARRRPRHPPKFNRTDGSRP